MASTVGTPTPIPMSNSTRADADPRTGAQMSAITTAVHDFPWVHRTLGLVGNVCFVVGSVFYLSPP